MKLTSSTALERARKGAKLLDSQMEIAWRGQVDRATLDMKHCKRCILGQVYGDFWAAVRRLFNGWADEDDTDTRVSQHGFSLDMEDLEDHEDLDWVTLQQAWETVLREAERI